MFSPDCSVDAGSDLLGFRVGEIVQSFHAYHFEIDEHARTDGVSPQHLSPFFVTDHRKTRLASPKRGIPNRFLMTAR